MHSSMFVRSLVLTHAVLAAAAPLARADEPKATVEEGDRSALPPFMLSSEVGYQVAGRDALSGLVDSFTLGVQVRSNSARRRDFLEVGVAQLHAGDSDTLPSSYLLIGARSTWSWDRIGLHLFGHIRHGDTASDGDFSTASESGSLGMVASVDVWRRSYLSLALGLHATANLYETLDAGERHTAASGSTGLSVIVW